MNSRKNLIDFIVKNGGKQNCGYSWRELLVKFDIHPSKANLKKASDWYRYYLRTNMIVPEKSLNSSKRSMTLARINNEEVTNEAQLFQEFLEWKKGTVQHHGKLPAKNKFTKKGLHIVLGCVHVPFHNKQLLNGITQFITEYKKNIAGFHLIGDFLDLNTLSFYDNGKFPVIKGLTVQDEYREGNEVLNKFDEILNKDTEKSFIYGNHEARWHKYANDMQKSKTLMESPHDALKLEERGYHVHEKWDQDYITLGEDLDIIHGTYFSVHAAKKHLDVFKRSIAFAHTHRIQSFIEGETGSYNIGCLINRDSAAFNYASRATKRHWQNGFAVVYIDDDKKYYFNQIRCNGNKFEYNGKLYG